MKASVEWLREYSDIDVDCVKLGDILTMTGSKVEEIIQKGNDIKNVVVGKILEIEKHPDADKLVITKVDVGTEKLQIVTGAKNIKVNDIIPVAKDGAELPNGVKIKTGKLRGVESCGMMCSVGELKLDIHDYPDQIENGIMILDKSLEKDLGKDIVEVLGLREEVIDFEITPNRPDCLSIEGLGRETAVSLNKPFKNPRKNIDEMNVPNKDEIEGLKVDISAPDLCYRYIARVVKNVKIGPSPEWMRKRLNACGIRSINNIVDITNYVMLEMGQPMHAFDINSINGKHITVRRAKNGEKITTLDEEKRTLDENDLVIADDEKAVAIAGVMGGLNSEIEKDTQTVVFESAMFYGGNIRKTAKKVGLRTESSSRYEKGLSSENTLRAVNRAVELVKLLGAGEEVEGKIDVYPTKQKINKIIEFKNVSYEYFDKWNNTKITALKNINLNINKGEFITLMGPNGSGKSTLAKHINGLLTPTTGDIYINKINTKDERYSTELKKMVGMVFQNPDNQMVASTVEEEIAFGLGNLCFAPEQMHKIIKETLKKVGMEGFEEKPVYSLSGGQKQRLAIAAVIAMNPEIIVLDEPTSMLDPEGKKEVLNLLKELNKLQNITIILITHYIEEALTSDKIIIIENNQISNFANPKDIFSDYENIKTNKFIPLDTTDILFFLKSKGYDVSLKAFEPQSCANEIIKLVNYDQLN